MLTPQQEAALTGGGDCFTHWHSEDRQATQELLQGLQGVAAQRSYDADTTLTGKEDFVLVDTSSANVTITLPWARNGLELELLKVSDSGTLIILPQGTNTIMGTTGATCTSGGSALRFKAFGTDWRLI